MLIHKLKENIKWIGILLSSLTVIIFFSSCSGHNVLLQAPPLQDETPALNTGFYTIYSLANGEINPSPGNPFLGNMLYLYKDQFFINGSFFTGIKGSFLPDFYIASKQVNGRVSHYWYQAENEENSGAMVIESIDHDKINLRLMTPAGKTEHVQLQYYAPYIWKPQVKTITIAHRGLCYQPPSNYEGIYPANTIPGFENALRAGYEGFELDVRLTKDKRFIVSHDEDLRVATTVRGSVAEKKLEDFKDILVVQSAPIPEKRSSARPAFIAAPMSSLKEILDEFLDDDRLHTIVVDVKPDKEEDILSAASLDFTGLTEEQQKKILFLTRTEGVARGLRKLVPGSDIAIEGSIGTEPAHPGHWTDFFPEAVGEPRKSHNTVSFGANWLLALDSEDKAKSKMNMVDSLSEALDYKSCYWTFAKDWRINFLRENEIFPDYILLDVPYYKMGLQQLRYTEGMELDLEQGKRPFLELDRFPVYKDIFDEHVKDFWFKSRQMYDLNYGVGAPIHADVGNSFAPVGNLEFKVGRSEIDKFSDANVELNNRYLFISFLNNAIHPAEAAGDQITTKSYRFGIGTNDGIGYTAGHDFSISPYVGQAFVWTRLTDFDAGSGEDAMNDSTILAQYPGKFRFGDRALYGIKVEISSLIQLNAYYETAVIYPRHQFWKWTGSFVLAEVGYGLIGHLADDFVNSQPVLGPIINFVLKSAYLYSYYSLRKKDMNWPFQTDTPLRLETINLGASLVF